MTEPNLAETDQSARTHGGESSLRADWSMSLYSHVTERVNKDYVSCKLI